MPEQSMDPLNNCILASTDFDHSRRALDSIRRNASRAQALLAKTTFIYPSTSHRIAFAAN